MSTPTVCRELFDHLRPLHNLRLRDAELLGAACAMFGSTDYGAPELESCDGPDRFCYQDWLIVRGVVRYSPETLSLTDCDVLSRLSNDHRRRVLWLSALARLADGVAPLCAGARAPLVAYLAWTDDVIYIEFDLHGVTAAEIRDRARSAALESVSGRRIILTSTSSRSHPHTPSSSAQDARTLC